MSTEQRSRPVDNQAAQNISGGDKSSIADTPGNAEWPTPEEIMDLVMRHPRARAVNWEGYQRGFLDGVAYAEQRLESVADLAARKFYAMETWEIDNRRRCQIDRDWFDVARARAAQGVRS